MSFSKYGSKKTIYAGTNYDSKKESVFARELDFKLKEHNGKLKSWTGQVRFPIVINEAHICDYVADFVLEYKDGSQEVIDVKSPYTAKLPVYRIKKKLVEAIYKIKILEK